MVRELGLVDDDLAADIRAQAMSGRRIATGSPVQQCMYPTSPAATSDCSTELCQRT